MTNKSKVISVLVVSFMTALIIKTFVLEELIVSGESMSPTIESGDYLFINKLAYISRNPKRGDIIIVKPRGNVGTVIKRIVGLPSERLQVVDGQVTVKNERTDPNITLDELYLNGLTTNAVGTTYVQLDPNEYFVFGDNRAVSIDSRELGPIDRLSIAGKPFLIFRLKSFKFIKIFL